MMTLPATHWKLHAPGPCPFPPDTPLWLVTKGSHGPFANTAGGFDWTWTDHHPLHVLAYAPLVENPYK